MKYSLSIEIDSIFTAFKEAFGCALKLMFSGPLRLVFSIIFLAVAEFFLSLLFGSAGWVLGTLRSTLTLYSLLVLAFTFIIYKDEKDKTYSIE